MSQFILELRQVLLDYSQNQSEPSGQKEVEVLPQSPAEVKTDDQDLSEINYHEELLNYSKLYSAVFETGILLLHKSILTGEYYLPAVLGELDEVILVANKTNEHTNQSFFFLSNPIDELIICCQIYKEFSQTVQSRLKYGKEIVFFTEDVSENEISHKNLNELVKKLEGLEDAQVPLADTLLDTERLLYRLNLKLAFLDLSLHCSNSILYDLINVSNYLKKHGKTEVFKIAQFLNDKCSYLIYKIFTRISGKNNSNHGLVSSNHEVLFYKNHHAQIVVDGTALNIKENDIENFKHFIGLTQKIYEQPSHFNFEHEKSEILKLESKVLTDLKTGAIEEIDYSEIHMLSRAYHVAAEYIDNVSGKAESLYQQVRDKRINYNEQKLGEFDKYAHQSLISLLFYNQLRTLKALLICAIKNRNHNSVIKCKNDLDKVFSNAEKVSNETNIHSYNPYRVYINAYIEYLGYELNEKRSDFTIEDLNNEVKKITPHFLQYTKNIEWAQDKNQLTLYLPYAQSFAQAETQLEQDKIKLFLDSSYILPINVDYLKKEQEFFYDLFQEKRILLTHELILRTKKGLEETIADRLQNTESVVAKRLESTENTIQGSIQANQIRNIEVLSLFTAILAFLLVGITTLPKFDDFFVMFLFMFGIAICLSIFVILIDYILKDRFNNKVLKISGIGFGIFVLLLAIKILIPNEVKIPFSGILAKDTSTGSKAPVPIVVATDTTADSPIAIVAADTNTKAPITMPKASSKGVDTSKAK